MNDEELKAIWKASNDRMQHINFHSINLKEMNEQIRKFEKSIETRNNREIWGAIILIVIFGYLTFIIPAMISKVGAILLITASIWIIYKLRKTQLKQPGFDIQNSIKQQLIDYHAYVKEEQQLLRNVLYWYLLPMLPGTLLFMLGVGIHWGVLLIYFSLVALVFIGIYFLNQRAANNKFTPLLADIEKTLQNLE